MANDVTEKKTLESEFENFFIRTKYLWISLICVVAVVLAVICIVIAVSSSSSKKASNFLEDAVFKYESALSNSAVEENESIENDFISTLQNYVASKGKNRNTVRVYMTLAKVYQDRQDWENALTNWHLAVKCGKNSYLAGIAEFNAGVCNEQLGNLNEACKCYKDAASNKNFYLVPHALFSQARVLESLGDTEQAKTVYNKIVNDFADSEWAGLAKSRVIYLNATLAPEAEETLAK